ncbi:hypothetical protein EC912_101619 [Luteibacter rhizovicinus]|uniref:Alpha-L-rhamnosidase six-hairpin glycosidase domain-containing protein n=1 Tax=Luteibacter rhizovicinus TaxID=242606 RepID=A0A4R3YYG8_9GAMM|nr:hypothetical protein [Luteibacter rhizovicinus]TCV97602.1 hypothetical protein EC912_101619 [Luteibacter rhizovicinus]
MPRCLTLLLIYLCACMTMSATAGVVVPDQRIVVHRNAGAEAEFPVSVGIPFAPGQLRDIHLLRIVDPQGNEVASAVEPTLRWHDKDNSIRAVRVQFRVRMDGPERSYYFAMGAPRTLETKGWPYAQGLVDGGKDGKLPAALATLTANWLCASLIAGPQIPARADEPYAAYVSAQFAWARKLPRTDPTAWLFDRPSTLFKAYVRTGRYDYLQAAEASYRYYMSGIRRDGLPLSPSCAGGWTYGDKPCDVKYVYVEPILLAVALTGDDSMHDTQTVDHMMTLWENGGWNPRAGPYRAPSDYFTERLAGLGLLETVAAFELTGDQRYRERMNDRIGWLYDHQRKNPDGLGDDGSWRNSWDVHENDTYHAATDLRGASPWMSENIVDGLWHAWLATGDPRIPGMVTGYGRYLERYGWIAPDLLASPHDWRNSCSGPRGQIAWYWSSSHASAKALTAIQESEGWYSDAHTVELGLPVAAAYYFERDPVQSAALKRRFEALSTSYATACAAAGDTLRRFNWNNRGAGVAQWMMRQKPGSGAIEASTLSSRWHGSSP